MKYNVLMIPSWYPTEENPISGSFFREQALALSRKFDFFVLSEYSYCGISIFRSAFRFITRKSFIRIRFEESDNLLPKVKIRQYSMLYNSYIDRCASFFGLSLEKLIQAKKKKLHEALFHSLCDEKHFSPALIYAMTAQINAIDAVSCCFII